MAPQQMEQRGTKGHGRWNRGRRISAKTIVTAAEWYTRRRHNIYRSTPMGSLPLQPPDHQGDHYLHPSSPQNLRKSGDMWGFSTEHNQPVRSYDDSSCLICPIGHIGWTQVDIATAIFSCWGRTRHLPDPRSDLTEFQEQTEAIHAFLSSPESVKKLEKRQMLIAPEALSPRDKQPIEFTHLSSLLGTHDGFGAGWLLARGYYARAITNLVVRR